MEILAATSSQARPFANGKESAGSTAVAFDQFLAGLLTPQAVLHAFPDFQAFQAGNSAGNSRPGQRDATAPVKNDPPARAAKENDRASRGDEPARRQAAEESRQRSAADRPAASGKTRRSEAGTEANRAPTRTGAGETRPNPAGVQAQASASTEAPKQAIQAGKDAFQTLDLHVTVERPQPTPSPRSVLSAGSSLVAMTAAQNQTAQNQATQNQGPALAVEPGGPTPAQPTSTQATSAQATPAIAATPGTADGQSPAGASDPSLLAGADAARREDPRTAARRAELRPTATPATPASPANGTPVMAGALHPQGPHMNGAAPRAASATAQAAITAASGAKTGALPGGGAEPLPATAGAKAAQVTSFLDTLSLAQGQTADGALKAARPNAAAPGAARPARMQVAVQIRQAVATGRDKISIQLHPSELGRVDIKLKMDHDGKVRAHIAADRPETLDLLMRDARGLERALQDAGLKTDSGSLTFQRHDSGGQAGSFLAQQEQSSGQQSYGGGSAGAAPAAEQPALASAETADDGRLNIQV